MNSKDVSQVLDSVLDGTSQGVLICADSSEYLAKLRKDLLHSVDCVYMDPPYRNGEIYYHYDDCANHEAWLTFMNSILTKTRDLLSPKGSVWISIDDTEMAYLKILCDRVFGSDAFIATIVWEHRRSRENRAAFSHNHEYLLVYAPDSEQFKRHRNKIESPHLKRFYQNPDHDPRGSWQSVTATAPSGHAAPSQYYAIISPDGTIEHVPPKGRCWVYNEERMKTEIQEGHIWFGKDGHGVPRIKRYLEESIPKVVPSTLWLADVAGTTTQAKRHIMKFHKGEGDFFGTPKPEQLLRRVLDIATLPGDLILDPFLGSGTTAAVAHKLDRTYIGIDKSLRSFEVACERMEHVVAGEQGGISKLVGWKGGGEYLTFLSDAMSNEETYHEERA